MSGALLAAGLGGAAGLGLSLRFTWWRKKRSGTPILMYHQVGTHRARLGAEQVARHGRGLRAGSSTLSCAAAIGAPRSASFSSRPLPEADGPSSRSTTATAASSTRALPALLARGFSATVFVVADRLGGVNDWDGETPGEALLSADEIRELHAQGHRDRLARRDAPRAHGALRRRAFAGGRGEPGDARARSSALPVTSFCYPFGDFDDRVVEAVRRAGYRAATVIRGGISKDLSDPFRLKRIAVRGTNTRLDFTLALTRGRSRL